MQDLLLLAAIAATFVLGWFLMKRLDDLLENNCQAQELQPESVGDTLRIGFSDPFLADSIGGILEQCSKRCSGISTYLFQGTEQELVKRLSAHRLNVIFLPEDADVPAKLHYNVREVRLSCTPVMMKYGGLPIEPIAKERIMQKVLWSEETKTAFVDCFIECLKDELDAPKPQ